MTLPTGKQARKQAARLAANLAAKMAVKAAEESTEDAPEEAGEPTEQDAVALQFQAIVNTFELRKLIADTRRTELRLSRERAIARQSRVYTFYGLVTPATIKKCMATLSVWSRQHPKAPLTIILNTLGGCVDDGLALYDYILHLRKCGHHVTTIAMGCAASMGAVLLQAGNVRIVAPNAFVMIHEMSAGTAGKVSEMTEDIAFYKRLQDKLVKILASRSTFTCRQLKNRWAKKDWWLDAREAVKLGFADDILKVEHLG
jgi:ATP-dependent Clp endopeptidase proteolytic subunit ClpP